MLSQIDKKIDKLYDNYKDQQIVVNAQLEVEELRRQAYYTGLFVSVAAFGLNEVSRLTLRSPIFKMRPGNVLFWAAAPTLFAHYSYEESIDEKVQNLWRVHKNRENQGLGGTYNQTNIYGEDDHSGHLQDLPFQINNHVQIRHDTLTHGVIDKTYLDNPYQKFHPSIEEYSSFLDDTDDIILHQTDNFERFKHTTPKEKDVVGATTPVPDDDNEDRFKFYDVMGESLYTNPPDPNFPTVDHGVGEEKIWAFRMTGYNQIQIPNAYLKGLFRSTRNTHIPFWGEKLMTPHFFKQDKFDKMLRHWDIRNRFELLKLRQAREEFTVQGDPSNMRDRHKAEIESFLEAAYDGEKLEQLKDVYVTDHKKQPKKVSTISDSDDQMLYNYHQQLKDYNNDAKSAQQPQRKRKYEKGSLAQKVFAPLQDAEVDENGTIKYHIEEKEIKAQFRDEEKLRSQWELMKNSVSEPMEFGDDEAEDMRIAVFDSLDEETPVEEWNNYIDQELGVFKAGEKYDYVSDLRRGFKDSLQKSQRQKIIETIPEHVFWDIKKPINTEQEWTKNPFNPFRKYPGQDFFDIRDNENYFYQRTKKDNIDVNTSKWRRY